jgi:hypothetical protein
MGCDLCWFVVPTVIVHDTAKPLCLGLEFEPENDDEVAGAIHALRHGPDACRDAYAKYAKEVEAIKHESVWGEQGAEWCPACRMYARGLWDTSLVLASQHIHHSYSNPIWRSDWCIRDLYMGKSRTPFLRRFSNTHMYREVTAEDVAHARRKVEDLGEPIRTSDKDACEETLRILSFLERWTADANARVIMQDEQ